MITTNILLGLIVVILFSFYWSYVGYEDKKEK